MVHGAVREEVGQKEGEERHFDDGGGAGEALRVLLGGVAKAALGNEVRGEEHADGHLQDHSLCLGVATGFQRASPLRYEHCMLDAGTGWLESAVERIIQRTARCMA